jgi:hypothetical protein
LCDEEEQNRHWLGNERGGLAVITKQNRVKNPNKLCTEYFVFRNFKMVETTVRHVVPLETFRNILKNQVPMEVPKSRTRSVTLYEYYPVRTVADFRGAATDVNGTTVER